jgi:hypothetical protein
MFRHFFGNACDHRLVESLFGAKVVWYRRESRVRFGDDFARRDPLESAVTEQTRGRIQQSFPSVFSTGIGLLNRHMNLHDYINLDIRCLSIDILYYVYR